MRPSLKSRPDNMLAILTMVISAYVLAILLSLLIGLTGAQYGRYVNFSYASMLIPTVAVMMASTTDGGLCDVVWSRFSWSYLPIALLLIPFVMHVAMLTSVHALDGRLPWQLWLKPAQNGFIHAPESLGWGAMTSVGLAMRLMLNAAIGVMIVSVLALFEEVGWRGWLLPRMSRRLGCRRGIVVTALIWALWHEPFIISGVLHVDGVSTRALASLHPIATTGAGLIIGWLWMRTRSIWIVSIAHGALNHWGQYAFKFMDFQNPGDAPRVLSAGSAALLFTGVLLLWFGVREVSRQTVLVEASTPLLR